MPSPETKAILITGTRKGIGRYLAEYYAASGFQVIGCSRNPIDYTLKNYEHFYLDISDESKVKEMFLQIRKKHKYLRALINNASLYLGLHVLLTPLSKAEEILKTNFTGAFLICREALKLMDHYSRIINLSTIAVPLASPGNSIYSASKAALEQFANVLAKEVNPRGITVNTIGLSIVNNSGMKEELKPEIIAETLKQTISKVPVEMEDISYMTDFLISEKSQKITGQTIYLGG